MRTTFHCVLLAKTGTPPGLVLHARFHTAVGQHARYSSDVTCARCLRADTAPNAITSADAQTMLVQLAPVPSRPFRKACFHYGRLFCELSHPSFPAEVGLS